jgi:aryl-alcohol dehydrogenase
VAEDDLEVLVRRIAPRGADHVIDTTASPAALDASLRALAMGGTAVLVGGAPVGTSAGIDMTTLLNGRRLQGVIQGDAVSRSFLPLLLDLHLAGRFPFDQLVRYYDLADVNVAAADMRSGRTVKPVLLPPSG